MEQIYKEEGVPVKTVTVEPRIFETELSYHAVLSGIEESSAYAMVGDKVEKILVNVGDFVQKDQVLMTFPTDNPGAQYSQAKVAFENAKTAYKRVENLFNTGGISQQELDNAKAGYDVAAANWDAVQQSVKVRAPISGQVTKVNVTESENVRRDAELFMISKTNKLKAKVWVAESEIQQVKTELPAMAVWNDSTISGKVVQVDMAMNQQVQAFGAVIEFDNRKNCVTCGVTADVIIKTYKNPSAIVVERKNILNDQDGSFVYVVNIGNAKKRSVKLGKQEGIEIEILEGLKQGDELIVEGQLLLEQDSKVKIIN
jgi:RND family efflux transporter MFP subunit